MTVRNCHLVSKTYFGTVEMNGGSEGVKYESVFLSMDENGNGLITLNEKIKCTKSLPILQ